EPSPLPVLAKVLGDVERLGSDSLIGLGQSVHPGELALQITLLVLGQPLADLVEPTVDNGARDLLLNEPSLIEQRHDSTVGDRLVDGVAVDQPPEGRQRVLLLLQKGRAGEAEVAGLWKEAAHLGGELAVAAVAPRLSPVALVDQHEDVRILVHQLAVSQRRIELVDDRGDQRSLVVDELQKVRPTRRPNRFEVTGLEGVLDLLVEIVAVRDDEDPRVLDAALESERAP